MLQITCISVTLERTMWVSGEVNDQCSLDLSLPPFGWVYNKRCYKLRLVQKKVDTVGKTTNTIDWEGRHQNFLVTSQAATKSSRINNQYVIQKLFLE